MSRAALAATLTTEDGIRLAARWWDAERPSGAVVVLVPGFTGSKDDPKTRAVARALLARGHHVLAYDARGHHGSDGLCTLGDLERLVTVGASMGAIAVLRYAAASPDLAGVVSVSSPALWRFPRNVRTVLAVLLTRTELGRRIAARRMHVRVSPRWRDPAPPRALAAMIRAPLAVVHGREDRFVPPSEAVLLATAAPNGRLFLVPGMGHAFDPAAIPAIAEAVDWALSASAPSAED